MTRVAVVFVVLATAGACGPPPAPATDYRATSDHYAFRVSYEPMPLRAREKVRYKIVVHDAKTDAPISNGEGQIYATSRDKLNAYDGLAPGKEIGTYYANMKFMTASDWAIAIRFRRDSTLPLERIEWTQEVKAERAGTP
ncbi:MAG: hypothetical protein M3081_12020 [Gemmatimonadota bacterium]|nr:hypothetical protein [Gemmatimonadota bacterium]